MGRALRRHRGAVSASALQMVGDDGRDVFCIPRGLGDGSSQPRSPILGVPNKRSRVTHAVL